MDVGEPWVVGVPLLFGGPVLVGNISERMAVWCPREAPLLALYLAPPYLTLEQKTCHISNLGSENIRGDQGR